MPKEDKILWQILAISGLNFVNYRLGPYSKYFRLFLTITFIYSLIYVVLGNWIFIRKNHFKEGFFYLLLPVYCALMWYFTYSKRKEISEVLRQIYRYKKKYNIFKRPRFFYIVPFMIIILISPSLTCIAIQIIVNFETVEITYWSVDFQVTKIIWKRILVFNGTFLLTTLCVCFPFYLTFSVNTLLYRCSEVLSSYNTVFEIKPQTKANESAEILKDFFGIVKLVRKLNHAITNISFFIVLYGLQGTFTILLIISTEDMFKLKAEYLISVAYYSTSCIVMFVSYTICSSMISENMIQIRTATDYINAWDYVQVFNRSNWFYLKRIESEEIVYISVCGLFRMTRGFIFSALGAVLTYGLLITSLQF